MNQKGQFRPGIPPGNISKYRRIYPLSGKAISSTINSTWEKEGLFLTPLVGSGMEGSRI